MVSASRALVDFYADVFQLSELPPFETPFAVIHRLDAAGATIKVMVPSDPPAPGQRVEPFYLATGIRYLTLRVQDLSGVLDRAGSHNARVVQERRELREGVFLVVMEDPDGNQIEVIEDQPLAATLRRPAGSA
jgi:predicted enzyme related to lactoylglutathione lyase